MYIQRKSLYTMVVVIRLVNWVHALDVIVMLFLSIEYLFRYMYTCQATCLL